VALIGVGNLGTAFLHYNFTKNNNTMIQLAFDVDPNKIGTEIADVPIYHINDIKKELANREIDVAILTVPVGAAQPIADDLAEAGIKGILNFTPARLTVPPHIRVHHIDLAVELQSLVYFMKQYPIEEE
jgi:redox-sensing transcriptional repressor